MIVGSNIFSESIQKSLVDIIIQFSMRMIRACFVFGLVVLAGCATTNFDVEKSETQALDMSVSTSLGKHVIDWSQEQGDSKSAFYPLKQGVDALGARLRLIDAAEESIDLQYFLMKDDVVGALLSAKLLDAADRGVRVRFLLDDIFTTIKDGTLYVLDEHENIEVRLFNPIARRGFQKLNYIGDFSRANRRMHNKSFTVDGSFTIVGGRNIAEEYFSLKDDSEFFDLDVLAKGAVVREVAESFDEFWNHNKSLPIESLSKTPSKKKLRQARARIEDVMKSAGADVYQAAINSQLLSDLIAKRLPDFIAEAHLISESPKKLELSTRDDSMRLGREIGEILLRAEDEVVILTPYFIPTAKGMGFWQQVIDSQVKISLVTNSLASTNHVPVHAAYEGYREGLLKMGFSLYETRPDAMLIITGVDQVSTLHTKLIVIDNRYLFIGSLNMDPRSIIINTEMGILIDSRELAKKMLKDRVSVFKQVVYELRLNEDDKIEWHGIDEGNQVVHNKEPQTSWWRRFTAKVYKIFPEGQL